jgi:hypothetical protein
MFQGSAAMKVFVHTKNDPKDQWANVGLEFSSIPAVGEHIVLTSASEWYEVFTVVHVPMGEGQYVAEIYAMRVNRHQVLKQPLKMKTPPILDV